MPIVEPTLLDAVATPARRREWPTDLPERRRALLHRLGVDIERVSGLAITGGLARKLARALASVEIGELAAWAARLRRLPGRDPEWLSLIEALTVHETFFFRDRKQFDMLARLLRESIAAAEANGSYRLRLWSAGCATGEEAYTLAIVALRALLEAGRADRSADGIVCRPPWRIEVIGTDVSRLVLTRARNAIYSTEAFGPFRDLPAEAERFFPAVPDQSAGARRVAPSVTGHVRFEQSNLIADPAPAADCDVVLCRNVLMYLTDPAKREAQTMLRQALRPGGFLLLGPTDAPADPGAFDARWGDDAVAYALTSRS